MKKKIIIYFLMVFITVVLGLVLFGPTIWWNSLETNLMNVWIVDKTVPISNYREHKGLMWV